MDKSRRVIPGAGDDRRGTRMYNIADEARGPATLYNGGQSQEVVRIVERGCKKGPEQQHLRREKKVAELRDAMAPPDGNGRARRPARWLRRARGQ